MAVALALAPMASHALGLGQIRSGSALNQPFQGDIDLLSIGADEIHQVKVRLAPADAFQRAGVEMAGPVGRLAFKPYVRPNGQAAIRVTTADPVREPFLNFLIEVEWPQGKTTKEYTVLLDPPIFTERRGGRARAAVATLPPVDEAPRERRPAPAARTATASGERYTVRQGDTLWSIAERSKPMGVSTPKAVEVIYAANPDAFIRGDKNLVRAGAELRLPTPAELGAMDVQTARREYLEQAREPAAEPEQPVAATGPGGAEPATDASDRLRLVTPPPAAGMAGMSGMGATEPSAATRQDLLLAQEKAESALQTAEQLQGRVADLETQLRDMQRLVLLKDEQLAQLQSQEGMVGMMGAEAPAVAEPAPAVTPPPLEPAPAEPAAEPAATVAPTPAEPPPTEAVTATTPAVPPPAVAEAPVAAEAPVPAAAVTPAPEEKPAEPAPAEPQPATPAVAEKPAAAEPPPATKPEPVAQPVAEATKPEPAPEGLAAILKEPTTLLGASAVIIALLGAWLLPIGSRRRKAEAAAAPAPVAPAAPAPKAVEPPPAVVAEKAERMEPAATAAAVAAAAGTTAAVAAPPSRPEPERVSTEDLAALELSTTDLFGLKGETTEVDPTEEADVYIAYGRYEQAEQLLRLALEMEPGRLALKHKLLEVYFAARDASAYNALFSELQSAGREAEDPAAWQRALRMGRQIDPDNPVYAGTAQDERDLEAALREAEEGLAADLKAGSADLDTLKIDTRFAESAADIDSGSVLNDLSLDLGTEEAGDKASHPFKLDVSEELEQLQKGGAGLAGELDEDDLAKAGGLPGGFGMEDLTPEQLEQDEDRSPDLSGIELTLEGGVPEQDTTLMHADTTLELVDDVETKLDLARAYIELGDNEGARGMLEEVLQEGNDAQKANAQTMLKELG